MLDQTPRADMPVRTAPFIMPAITLMSDPILCRWPLMVRSSLSSFADHCGLPDK